VFLGIKCRNLQLANRFRGYFGENSRLQIKLAYSEIFVNLAERDHELFKPAKTGADCEL
jgi:hypothetical protein